ncbi:AP2 domain containing protein [Musa troglodytarum]|uniref:AP2 domain containing protein n=1 Tax=Musa troglodytarum TaxID=320322 RepID=A0A9E7I8V8_9LILI|nr:AP2 domain containing protein [Musa troglodytarum]
MAAAAADAEEQRGAPENRGGEERKEPKSSLLALSVSGPHTLILGSASLFVRATRLLGVEASLVAARRRWPKAKEKAIDCKLQNSAFDRSRVPFSPLEIQSLGRAPAAVMTVEVRYRGVRKRSYPDVWKKARVWLGTFDSVEDVAWAFGVAAVAFREPEAIRPTSPPLLRLLSLPSAPPPLRDSPLEDRPTYNNFSSTVKSFSGGCADPRGRPIRRPNTSLSARRIAILIAADDTGHLASTCRQLLPFDINLLSPANNDFPPGALHQ